MADGPARANANVDFAALLKRLRTAAGLTQEELAERASLSARGISDLERGLKRHPHRETVRLLTAALNLSPEASAAFLAASNPAATPRFDALPAPTSSFIGRGETIQSVVDILSAGETRLLTLIGPGGVGKTRLALRVAAELRETYKDGAAFVSLAAITDPSQAPGAVMRALGIKNAAGRPVFDALTAELRAKRLLLVLDNCEQAPFGPFAADLLSACPGVAVIATSRAPLHVSAEQEFEVPSLDLPDPDRLPPLDQLAGTAAVALFVARARAVKPSFTLTDANALAVATICARLDGLPLAIELAAVRTKVLTPASLAELLAERLRILTDGPVDAPARHRTMRAAIAWSADLLDERERVAFRRLAVFSGGCTLEDAAAVLELGDVVEVLDALTRLVDQSLVRRDEGRASDARFVMLETIRDYAAEQLAQSGEQEDIRARHAANGLAFVERIEPLLTGSDAAVWLDRVGDDHANLWAALDWFICRKRADEALQITSKLWRYWWLRGYLREGRDWLARALSIRSLASPAKVAQALNTLGNISIDLSDYAAARRAYEESLTIRRQIGDPLRIADCLHNLGMVVGYSGDYELARAMVEEALVVARATPNQEQFVASSLMVLGELSYCVGDYRLAQSQLEESRDILTTLGDPLLVGYANLYLGIALRELDPVASRRLLEANFENHRIAHDKLAESLVLPELAQAAIEQGELDVAATRFREGLKLAQEIGATHSVLKCVEGFAELATRGGQFSEALRLFGAAHAGRIELGRPLPPVEQARVDRVMNDARAAFGEDARAAPPAPFDEVVSGLLLP